MAYRNGTYIAFHAEGKSDPTASDIKYYRMLKAWHENDGIHFNFVNSHEKVDAVRDNASKAKIKSSLEERLDNSKNMVLIVGPKTKLDTDFVPHEINYAVNNCQIPLIVTYTGYTAITEPALLRDLWPAALARHIDAKAVKAIHIPFKRHVIDAAIGQFNLSTQPNGALSYYPRDFQERDG